MRPGSRFIDVHSKALEVVGRELLKLGFGDEEHPEQASLYLFHGSGHPIGLQTHVARYDGIGVRIEDDVLITTAEPRILSAGAPRSARDIEAHMANKQMIR